MYTSIPFVIFFNLIILCSIESSQFLWQSTKPCCKATCITSSDRDKGDVCSDLFDKIISGMVSARWNMPASVVGACQRRLAGPRPARPPPPEQQTLQGCAPAALSLTTVTISPALLRRTVLFYCIAITSILRPKVPANGLLCLFHSPRNNECSRFPMLDCCFRSLSLLMSLVFNVIFWLN